MHYPHLDLKLKESWQIIPNGENNYDKYEKPAFADFHSLNKKKKNVPRAKYIIFIQLLCLSRV